MEKLATPKITGENISPDELAIHRTLRPYLHRCLSLNHDVNNALAGIIGYTEFLLEEAHELSDEHRRFLTQILQSAERIQRIVEDLCAEKIAASEKIDVKALVKELEQLPRQSD